MSFARSAKAQQVAVATFGLALTLGCATQGLRIEELPAEPIAFVYWQPEQARRRADLLERSQDPAAAAASVLPTRRGVARVDGLRSYLGGNAARSPAMHIPGRLSIFHPHTGEVRRLSAAPPGARPLAWSSDHSRLLFASSHGTGQYRLFEYDVARDEVRPRTFGGEHSFIGDLGPDDQLAYAALAVENGAVRARIYVTRSGGLPPRVVAEEAPVESVRWSPSGDTVVYARRELPSADAVASRTDTLPVIASRAVDGSGSERKLAPGRDPVFTPDGAWIVYTAPARGRWRLRRMRPDGSGRSFVGLGNFEETTPALSRDGRFVVYVAGETGSERLFVRRMDGSGDRVLLSDGAMISPVW